MKERRKRLILSLYTKEKVKISTKDPNSSNISETNEYDDFHAEYENKLLRNNTILQGMSAKELEEHLKDFAYAGRRQSRESTKNVAHEVISCIIDLDHGWKGILTDIIKWLKSMNQRGISNPANRKFYNFATDGFNVDSTLQDNRMISGTMYATNHDYPDIKFDSVKSKMGWNSSFSTQGNFCKDGAEGDDTPNSKSKHSNINKSYDRSYMAQAVGKVIVESRK